MNSHAVRGRRLARLEPRAELAGNDAAALIHVYDPCAAKELEIVVDGVMHDAWAEAEAPSVGIVRELLPHGA